MGDGQRPVAAGEAGLSLHYRSCYQLRIAGIAPLLLAHAWPHGGCRGVVVMLVVVLLMRAWGGDGCCGRGFLAALAVPASLSAAVQQYNWSQWCSGSADSKHVGSMLQLAVR